MKSNSLFLDDFEIGLAAGPSAGSRAPSLGGITFSGGRSILFALENHVVARDSTRHLQNELLRAPTIETAVV